MQMKNRSGITLIALVITIVVLFIILSITLNYGLSELHDVSNKKTESELGIVQEAIMQRYALVKSSNQLGIIAPAISANANIDADTEKTRPKGLVGTRIADCQTDIINNGFTGISLMSTYSSGEGNKKFEEFYYSLNEADLIELGIEKGDETKISDDVSPKARSYIVNYSTGEVFDTANKKYYKTDSTDDDLIYKQPTSITMDEKNYEFNDD